METPTETKPQESIPPRCNPTVLRDQEECHLKSMFQSQPDVGTNVDEYTTRGEEDNDEVTRVPNKMITVMQFLMFRHISRHSEQS